jgi:hypothetical protein
MTRPDAYAALTDAYMMGDPADILAAEYAYLLAVLAPVTEWQARNAKIEEQPTLLDLLAAFLPDHFPHGAAPSLRDTLYALDLAFAEWQAESGAWQRWQARQVAVLTATIEATHISLS